ncbi:vegetative incompatibility protein HET-E-1 [Colletotrichum limetticola]|uniref:Vegetative incompatibility protein HET-E-1 n=1 Tax=Colletotrichum limetticola TaxID=1209924 RepID=A0ABQ9Q995_9PEZI|nr:vegetative incompatibility protein HET-E-1 [Colletotrichum limetticola]
MADPLSTAGSVVGIISLGIQVVQSIYKYYSAAKDQHSDIARTLRKLEDLQSLFERLNTHLSDRKFRSSEAALLQNIESTIQHCEESIDELEQEARKFEKKPTDGARAAIKGVVRRLAYPFRESTLLKLHEDIDYLISQLSLALSLLQQQTIDLVQDEIENTNAILNLIRTSQVSSEIRTWLNAPDATFNFTEACSKKHPGTGTWFVNGPEFTRWLEGSNSFLWLKGFAGCGKTVLSSTVIQHTLRHRRSNPSIGLCFFFFSFNDVSKQDASAMLRALILQLSDQLDYVPSALQRIHDLRKKHNIPPSTADLLQCFRQVLQLFQNVYVVLDALDESPRETSRFDLLETLKDIRTWPKLGLHLLVTSRDEVDIREGLEVGEQATILMKHEGIDDDIASYVSQYLQRRLKLWTEHHALIEKVLTEKAHGVFRWVECQFKALATCPRSKQALDRRLQSLPPTLDETYKRMLDNVSDKDYAKQMLTILCCALRPLTVLELINAMAVEIGATSFLNPDRQLPDADSLLEICPGFTEVAMDNSTGMAVIRIAHFSIQEYLESDRILLPEGYASFSIHKRCGDLLLASACLTLLLESELQMFEREETVEKYPFAAYAAKEWVNHWRKGTEIGAALYDSQSHCNLEVSHDSLVLRLQKQMLLLFRDTAGAMRNWRKLWNLDIYWSEKDDEMPHPLYYASLIGTRFLVEGLYEDWKTRCSLKQPTEGCIDHMRGTSPGTSGSFATPIQAAAAFGHRDVVEFFLDKGANPNIKVEQTFRAYGTPLMTASAHGQTEIMELLLARGAEVNAIWSIPTEPDHRRWHLCSETAASSVGQKEAVELLLKHGAVDDIHPGFIQYTMSTASEKHVPCRRVMCINLLLQIFDASKVTTNPEMFELYMEAALQTGNTDLVEKYLGKWILCGRPEFSPGRSLRLASAGGHQSIIHQLLRSGAIAVGSGQVRQISSLRGAMEPALQEASRNGHLEVVNLLLSFGATEDFPLCREDFGSALRGAAAEGHEEIVKLFLDNGVNPNHSDETQMPALHVAILVGSERTFQLLLDAGADIHARFRGGLFESALSAACNGDNIGIVEILMARGASFLATDSVAATIGADTKGLANRPWDLWDQIPFSVSESDIRLAITYLKKGDYAIVDFAVSDDKHDTEAISLDPLSSAVLGGHMSIVQRLLGTLSEGNVGNRDDRLRAALATAAACGNIEAVKLILDFDSQVPLKDLGWNRARYLASLMGYRDVVQVLVGKSESLVSEDNPEIRLPFEQDGNLEICS